MITVLVKNVAVRWGTQYHKGSHKDRPNHPWFFATLTDLKNIFLSIKFWKNYEQYFNRFLIDNVNLGTNDETGEPYRTCWWRFFSQQFYAVFVKLRGPERITRYIGSIRGLEYFFEMSYRFEMSNRIMFCKGFTLFKVSQVSKIP